MDLEGLFVDLDGVRWADVDHAYGVADDLPGMLRALAGDEEQAHEALTELWSSILHQGTVYSATAEAVPFLARLAAAGVCSVPSAGLLVLLGGIAESQDEHGVPEPGACRTAVAAQLPLILPLMDSGEPEIRRAAVWAAGRTRAAAALPALRRHWRREDETPAVRAELLAALAHADPADGAPAATAALGSETPAELRIVAVLTCVDLGLPWTAEHREAMVSLLPAGPRVADRFDTDRTEPLAHTVDALLRRDTDEDRSAAYELIEAALRPSDPEIRAEALWAAEHACMISRSAPARLAPALLALQKDAGAAGTAALLPVLDKLGGHATPAAPGLSALAAGEGDLADRALCVLVRLDPAQAAPLLALDLGGRRRTMQLVAGALGGRPALAIPYEPRLLNAIRIRLSGIAVADDRAAGDPGPLAALLRGWGPRAAAALPELTAVFARCPAPVARALAAICPPESRERTAGLLRRAAESGETEGRCAAAEALRTLTGETAPLAEALKDALEQGIRPQEIETAGELGPDGAVLVPGLRAALARRSRSRTVGEMNADVAGALALWRLTGEADEAVPVLGGVLAEAADGVWTGRSVVAAARAAALLGPAAVALAPALERLLGDPARTPEALLALHRLGRGIEPARAADLLLGSAERGAEWPTALEALELLGPEALTPEVTARLKALAEDDLRVVTSPSGREVVPGDERLRARARELLTRV